MKQSHDGMAPSGEARAGGQQSDGAKAFTLVPGPAAQTHWVSVRSLLRADSPRRNGEDAEHIRMLAAVEAKLPPILVHRASMRVIDGMHRLGAARLRNEELIEVRFFEGSEEEAFILGVKANITHGRPLSLSDRTTAAERIIALHPSWSDRAIAAAAGIGARMVANLRRRAGSENDTFGDVRARVGRDGRIRPTDHTEGRLKAAAAIKESPNAPLREIARKAGVSPATARDVRFRLQQGENPVPDGDRQIKRPVGGRPGPRCSPRPAEDGTNLEVLLQGLRADPSLRFSESGRELLRWVISKALRPGEWDTVSNELPPHTAYVLANVARRCVSQWQQVADDLDERARRTAS